MIPLLAVTRSVPEIPLAGHRLASSLIRPERLNLLLFPCSLRF